MAVKIITEIEFEGENIEVKDYRTERGRIVSPKEKKKADEIDKILEERCNWMIAELDGKKLIKWGKKQNFFKTANTGYQLTVQVLDWVF